MDNRIERSLVYLHWCLIAGAALDVYLENEARERDGKARRKANADTWATEDELRLEIWTRIREHWRRRLRRAGAEPGPFPYNLDCTAKLYFRFRKRNAAEVEAFKAEIAAAQAGLEGSGPPDLWADHAGD